MNTMDKWKHLQYRKSVGKNDMKWPKVITISDSDGKKFVRDTSRLYSQPTTKDHTSVMIWTCISVNDAFMSQMELWICEIALILSYNQNFYLLLRIFSKINPILLLTRFGVLSHFVNMRTVVHSKGHRGAEIARKKPHT